MTTKLFMLVVVVGGLLIPLLDVITDHLPNSTSQSERAIEGND